jgi:hypothetical protein
MTAWRTGQDDDGQASVELIALLPVVAVLAALVWQAVLAGTAWWLCGSAARAGARARAIGADPAAAVRAVLPEELERGVVVRTDGDGVRVRVRVPVLLGRPGVLGAVQARARMEPQT